MKVKEQLWWQHPYLHVIWKIGLNQVRKKELNIQQSPSADLKGVSFLHNCNCSEEKQKDTSVKTREGTVWKCYTHTDYKQGKVKLDLNLSSFLLLSIMLVLRKPSGLSHSPEKEKSLSVLIQSLLNESTAVHGLVLTLACSSSFTPRLGRQR